MERSAEKKMNRLREQIADAEWNMFQLTRNVGGRASCQDDYSTFYKMRMAQFHVWDDETAGSYLEDLKEAGNQGRNLIAEKYLHMMKYTYPEEYEKQKHFLPVITEEKAALANEICDEMLRQTVSLREKFPHVGKTGRPLFRTEDKYGVTSIQTYQMGELLTYSEHTLKHLKDHLFALKAEGISMAKEITSGSICSYGFSSLEEAEEFLSKKEKCSE